MPPNGKRLLRIRVLSVPFSSGVLRLSNASLVQVEMGKSGSSRFAVLRPSFSLGYLYTEIAHLEKQTGLVKSKFVEAIQNYQEVERQYRAKYKQRMERQFRIVKPDATPEEVKAVVEDDQGGQIFSQAVCNHLHPYSADLLRLLISWNKSSY
jgi:Syntaxin